MIHKIKALHNEGAGLSIRSIARELGIARNTVRKYLRMDEVAIGEQQSHRTRHKQLDDYRDYIVTLLSQFPHLSAVKVLRKLLDCSIAWPIVLPITAIPRVSNTAYGSWWPSGCMAWRWATKT